MVDGPTVPPRRSMGSGREMRYVSPDCDGTTIPWGDTG